MKGAERGLEDLCSLTTVVMPVYLFLFSLVALQPNSDCWWTGCFCFTRCEGLSQKKRLQGGKSTCILASPAAPSLRVNESVTPCPGVLAMLGYCHTASPGCRNVRQYCLLVTQDASTPLHVRMSLCEAVWGVPVRQISHLKIIFQ